jgi:hypothetical protein
MSIGACATPAAAPVRATVAAATVPAPREAPTPLGPRRTARLEAVQESLSPALAEWSLAEVGTRCTLVFDAEGEWLTGCALSSPPAGFAPTGERFLGAPVMHTPQSLVLGERRVPFAQARTTVVGTVAQQTGPDGAESPVLVLQEWDALHEAHPGFVDSGIEEWLSIGVHEAFHAHQMWHPRVRARMDGWKARTVPVATKEDLAAFYGRDDEYRRAVDAEIDALRTAYVGAQRPEEARRALADWHARYTKRRATFAGRLETAFPGKNAWAMDAFYTFLEGTARYVEARFLVSPPTTIGARLEREPTFRHFASTAGKPVTELPGLGRGGPKYVYALGMYLSFLLDRAAPGWKTRVMTDDDLLVGEVARAARGG